ncbi:urease accessory protein UreD [Phreatobacter aquaticus]|uniref:Urease accessory protein UreD n=1 Tax=Phreatobacter aquaticus TaxID=2570229 RepID=A0A4D7QNZ9_9HYPH|nr:urease accessory protein UreD [Phreatobacter aquaticus]QCK87286.1 urease accessory protein UreD [Phreatobacter aquaticus]
MTIALAADWDRAAARAGTAGAMQRAHGVGRLSFLRRGDVTAIHDSYQEAALRLRMPKPERGGPLEVVIINTAGGLTGGDRFDLSIDAGPQTRAVVTTQAAEKVYRSSGDKGRFHTTIKVGEGASLDWLPQEAILFDGSALDRRLDVTMATDSTFLAVEAVVFGRLARGETVDRAFLFDRWRIRRGGRLVYAEGLAVEGDLADQIARKAAAGAGLAIASVVLASPDAETKLEALRAVLDAAAADDVESGASAFDGLLTLRLVSADPFSLRKLLVTLLEHLRGPLPRVWSC